MENEYFQFFPDLQVLSRFEAEFAILLRIVLLTAPQNVRNIWK